MIRTASHLCEVAQPSSIWTMVDYIPFTCAFPTLTGQNVSHWKIIIIPYCDVPGQPVTANLNSNLKEPTFPPFFDSFCQPKRISVIIWCCTSIFWLFKCFIVISLRTTCHLKWFDHNILCDQTFFFCLLCTLRLSGPLIAL